MGEDRKRIEAIVYSYEKDRRHALAIMQDMQRKFQYIPREGMEIMAEYLECPVAQLYSMATFYKALSLKPKGRHIIKCCDGTACHVRKSAPILEAFQKELGLSSRKHTTDDMMFTVETVSCLGACGLAPTVMVNEEVHPRMTPEKALELIHELRGDKDD